MCGIVGYLGQKIEANWLVGILKKLEYRGYDSSGVAGFNESGLKIIKKTGQIKNLEEALPKTWEIELGLLHTRWATHGKPSEQNAHPHLSGDGKWVLVHNGIIENADSLKNAYSIKTKGETDTEVLTEYLAKKCPKNLKEFVRAFDEVEGSYAIICQCVGQKKLYLAKKASPLYVAEDLKHNFLIASDPICFSGFANTSFMLEDGIFAEVDDNKISFCDSEGNERKLQKINVENCQLVCKETAVESFMLKEIFDQPIALRRQVENYRKNKVLDRFDKNFISKFNKVMLLGCGSAYHAGIVGAKYVEQILGISAQAVVASEFVYNNNVFDQNTLFILLSQSGETADTLNALKIIKEKKAFAVAVTNVPYSSLAQKVDVVVDICAGPEIAVASTKAYVCMLSSLYLMVMQMNGQVEIAFTEIEDASIKLLDFDFEKVERLAQTFQKEKFVVMLGKNFDYVTALEASLKLKEIAYIYTMALPSGELKHGYLALVEGGTQIINFATQKSLIAKNINAGLEAESRGGMVTLVSPWAKEEEIKIPETNHLIMPILSIVPMQYLAYRVSVLKELSPDKPRNLAKSVTVE